jgi:hypothetical protein
MTTIFQQLSHNKGTISSALGKTLAHEVLEQGRNDILLECIRLASYDGSDPAAKSIRSGAAKVVEIAAEKRPELVAPHLAELLPALSVEEPQTRWMIIRVMGFCAALNRPTAHKAIPFAESYLRAKEGLAIASSADLFLGELGAISRRDAARVFPILERSMSRAIGNEQDWLLESVLKLFANLDAAAQKKAIQFAKRWQTSTRKSTQERARRILNLAD